MDSTPPDDFEQRLAEQQQTVDVLMELNGALTTRYLAVLLNEARDTIAKQGARIGVLENQMKAMNERLDKASDVVRGLRRDVAKTVPQPPAEA